MIFFHVFLSQAMAHFNLNVNLRVIHVSHEVDGLRMYIRLPMAYLVADKVGPEDENNVPQAAPFTTNRFEDNVLVHYLDAEALRRDPLALGQIITKGHRLTFGENAFTGELIKVRAYPALKQVPFAQLKEAKKALEGEVYQSDFEVTYVGDTIVDAEIFFPSERAIRSYSLSSTLNPGLPGQDETANLILDHSFDETLTYRVRGTLAEPFTVSRSSLQAIKTFIWESIRHILEGIDHVLFVLCLVLGTKQLGSLLWRVTGFTVGHSITISAGFLGYVPSGPWFVPFVETCIALSIIYVAITAVSKTSNNHSFVITTAMGLLHGLGFSFVLSEILQLNSVNLWQSLLAFNVGVEIGQIIIVTISWIFLLAVAKYLAKYENQVRLGIVVPCLMVASVWTGQRFFQFVGSL